MIGERAKVRMSLPTDEVIQMATDSTLASIGSKITYGGAFTAFGSFLLSSSGAAVVGIIGVILGLVIQWYFKRREDARLEAFRVKEDARLQKEEERLQEQHLWSREIHIARLAQITAGNLKATPAEIIDDIKSVPRPSPIPIEETIVSTLEKIK